MPPPARKTVLPFFRIPRDAELGTKIEVRLMDRAFKPVEELVIKLSQSCDSGQITIGPAGVTAVVQAGRDGQVRPELPLVSKVGFEAVVVLSASREAKSRPFG